MKQLTADCSLMEELRVMDYSLLLGVHYRSPGYASSPQVTDKVMPVQQASCGFVHAIFAFLARPLLSFVACITHMCILS